MGTGWYLVTAAGELHYTEFCILADLYKGGVQCEGEGVCFLACVMASPRQGGRCLLLYLSSSLLLRTTQGET